MRRGRRLLLMLVSMLALLMPPAVADQVPDATFSVAFPTASAVFPAPVKSRLRTFVLAQPLGTKFVVQGTLLRDAKGRTDAALTTARGKVVRQFLLSLGVVSVSVLTPGRAQLLRSSDLVARQLRVGALRPVAPAMPSFAVHYDANGGGVTTTDDTYTLGGSPLVLPKPEAPRGHAFLGWYSSAAGGTFYGLAGATFTPIADTTVYAHWRHMTTTLHLTVIDTDQYAPRPGYVEGCLESCTVVILPRVITGMTQSRAPIFDQTLLVEVGSTITIRLHGYRNWASTSSGATCTQTKFALSPIDEALFTCTGFSEGVPSAFVIDIAAQ